MLPSPTTATGAGGTIALLINCPPLKALLQLEELGARALLRNLHVAQHGILPDHKGMRIARLALRQRFELLERLVKPGVIGEKNVGSRLLDDVLIARGRIDVGLEGLRQELEVEPGAAPGRNRMRAAAVLDREDRRNGPWGVARRYRNRMFGLVGPAL